MVLKSHRKNDCSLWRFRFPTLAHCKHGVEKDSKTMREMVNYQQMARGVKFAWKQWVNNNE